LNSESDHEYESEDLFEINTAEAESFIKQTEINYIINNPESNISQESEDNETEEKIFRNDGGCDIFLILELRKSHEAFSRPDLPRGIQTRTAINLNLG
jgi:hypothetical protein